MKIKLLILFILWFGYPHYSPGQSGQPNIVFILSDDHRHDFMGFTGAVAGLQTPNMDRLAREGTHFKNAFVSKALCSPSRASILMGQYAHTHLIVDNSAPLPEGLTFFPQHLQKLGYQTGFFGKWHMGNTDDMPQPGFDQWVSFRGQGVYFNPTFINGERIQQPEGSYTTDQFKFIFYRGIWDINELYDIQNDPFEMNHLIRHPDFQEIAKNLRNEIWDWQAKTGGDQIPLKRIEHPKLDHKHQRTY